jgi:hypothetical protein
VLAIVPISADTYWKAVRAKVEQAAAGRALLVDCPGLAGCTALPRHVLVRESVSDGDGCYDTYSFGGNCSARSQDVRLEVAFVKGGTQLSTQSISATTPAHFKYKAPGLIVTTGPSREDIRAATKQALDAALAQLDLVFVERLLEP